MLFSQTSVNRKSCWKVAIFYHTDDSQKEYVFSLLHNFDASFASISTYKRLIKFVICNQQVTSSDNHSSRNFTVVGYENVYILYFFVQIFFNIVFIKIKNKIVKNICLYSRSSKIFLIIF